MDDALLSKLRNKLLFALGIIVSAVLLIGDEDSPGMVAQMQEETQLADQGEPVENSPALPDEPGLAEANPEAEVELNNWYAQAGPSEAEEPVGIDDSHLIDNTKPFLETNPAEPVAGAEVGIEVDEIVR